MIFTKNWYEKNRLNIILLIYLKILYNTKKIIIKFKLFRYQK